jgi:two-component system response regulator YesN
MEGTIKLLVVDDEKWELNYLNSLISREFLKQCIVTLASNGKEAIDLFKEDTFDIVIMDINMPVINGLEAIKEIKSEYGDVEFLILTAHGEFEYAQQAIELGTNGYLLKPVEPVHLITKINSIIKKIENKQEVFLEHIKLREKFIQIAPLMQNFFLELLIFEQFQDTSEIQEYAKLFKISEFPKQVIILQVNDVSDQKSIQKENIFMIKEYVSKKLPAILFQDKIITCTNNLESTLQDLREIKRQFDITIRIGVGLSLDDPGQLYQSYNQALQALCYTNITPNHSISLYADIINLSKINNRTWDVNKNNLVKYIRHNEKLKVLESIELLFNPIKGENDTIVTKIKAMELLYDFDELLEQGFEKQKDIEKIKYFSMIINCNSMEDIKWSLTHIVNSILKSLHKNPKNYQEQVIQKCKWYIEEHYMKEISLTQLSEEFHVNPTYLSKLFKKVFGTSFVEYLHQIRINKSKFLLVNKNHITIEEISNQVGYNTQHYFSYVFKKRVGYTPTEYRFNNQR